MDERRAKPDAAQDEAAREAQGRMIKSALRRAWLGEFDERQRRLISNARQYASGDPAGLPGHQLMLIIAKMADWLDGINCQSGCG